MSRKEKSLSKRSISYRKTGHPMNNRGGQGWETTDISDTLNVFDYTEQRTPILIVEVTRNE